MASQRLRGGTVLYNCKFSKDKMHPNSTPLEPNFQRHHHHHQVSSVHHQQRIVPPPDEAMEPSHNHRAHFILIPFLAQGHIIPMVDLGFLLAERNALVTLVTTPFNAQRLRPCIQRSAASGLPIRFVSLPFPTDEVGLPPNGENVDVLPPELGRVFMDALPLLDRPLRLYLRHRPPLPTCIVSDFCLPWTRHVARDLGLRRYVFYSVCCFTLTCNCILGRLYERHPVADPSEPFVIPELEHHRVEVSRERAKGFFYGESVRQLRHDVEEADATSDGIIVNTFAEMEPMYLESYAREMGRRVWAVGPVSLYNKAVEDRASRGASPAVDEGDVMSWFDSKAPESVVYFCLGSLTRTRSDQVKEIGLGLLDSGSPFIWVIKGGTAELDTWLEEEFEQTNGGRGFLIRGWAPQVLILAHPSVGGFVTHCGWNSSMEGIATGVPMVTWPHFSDQFLNERLLVDVVGTGVAVGVEKPNEWWMEEKTQLVDRGMLAVAVKKVMGGEVEAEERRKKAKELGEKAREAMKEGGSSNINVTRLIEEVMGI